jgi:transcriptional regulator with XRE-family HTH domain
MMVTLREARATRLLTVRGLAERAGVAFSTVHLIETGKSVPHFDAIQKLSAALDMEPTEIAEFAAAIEAVGQGKGAAVALVTPKATAG